MPKSQRPDPLYQRGTYRLYARPGRGNLEIIWYDSAAGRERSRSAGTGDVSTGRLALDRLYLQSEEGRQICPTCGQERHASGSQLVTAAIADYLILTADRASADAIRARLAHVVAYLAHVDVTTRCDQVDEDWIARFRKWLVAQPIVSPTGMERPRSLSTVENSVLQLAAAINSAFKRRATSQPARFRPIPAAEVNASPLHRATVEQMAAMFRYAMVPKAGRDNLLRYLRAAVATWARPDAIMDISTDPARRQWMPAASVLSLNPHGRRQTRKYRATIPVPRQFAAHLDQTKGFYVPVKSIRSAWDSMAAELQMPGDGEAGTKLIRRSVSHIVRQIIGEEHWVQGQIFLGHHKASTSDVYALRQPGNLGLALAATESVIDEIEKLAPGAFYRDDTATGGSVASIRRAKNGS